MINKTNDRAYTAANQQGVPDIKPDISYDPICVP